VSKIWGLRRETKEKKVTWLAETEDVILQHSSSSGDHHLKVKMLAQLLTNLRSLECKLTSGDKDHSWRKGWGETKTNLKRGLGQLTLDHILALVDLFEERDEEGGGLAGPVLCPGQDIAACQCHGNALLLNW